MAMMRVSLGAAALLAAAAAAAAGASAAAVPVLPGVVLAAPSQPAELLPRRLPADAAAVVGGGGGGGDRRRQTTVCAPLTVLTAPNGVVTDHLGPGNYPVDTACQWTIDLRANSTVTGILIDFVKMDLETRFDWVGFWTSAPPNGYAELWFSGDGHPAPFVLDSPVITAYFSSDELITRTGFAFAYHAQNCPEGCNGHGVCRNGRCECDLGWRGWTCAISECIEDPANGELCGLHGQCNGVRNQCICEVGYYGYACEDPYCTGNGGEHLFTGVNGTFSDHVGGGEYRNGVRCGWTIAPAGWGEGATIALSFLAFDVELDWDFVYVYAGTNSSAPRLAVFSGDTPPPTLYSTAPALYVEFTTDSGLARQGFTARYELLACPAACNGNGLCVLASSGGAVAPPGIGVCHCDHGFTGADCSVAECYNDCHAATGSGVCNATTNMCDCAPGFGAADCGLCLTNASCASINFTQCAGAAVIDTQPPAPGELPHGAFRDHVGAGDVLPSTSCSWLLDARPWFNTSDYSLDLSFDLVDLGAGSVLRVVAAAPALGVTDEAELLRVVGPSTASSSSTSPLDLPVPVSVGASVAYLRVEFSSGPSVEVADGFRAIWDVSQCVGGCGEHGRCTHSGCTCEDGWTGAACNTPTCVLPSGGASGPECSGFGTCTAGQQCECQPGRYGPLCGSVYCNGLTVLDQESGSFTDHNFNEAVYYLPETSCSFLIQPTAGSGPVSAVFESLSTEFQNDFVRVYDGTTADSARLVRTLSGTFAFTPVASTGPENALFVEFTSNDRLEFAGFNLSYTRASQCPGSCSGNGVCDPRNPGACICEGGWSGTDCSTAATSQLLALDVLGRAPVDKFEWQFFHVVLDGSGLPFESLTVEHDLVDSNGHAQFFLRAGRFPNEYAFDQTVPFYSPRYMRVANPVAGVPYYVGVYGVEGGVGSVRFRALRQTPPHTPPSQAPPSSPPSPVVSGGDDGDNDGEVNPNGGVFIGVGVAFVVAAVLVSAVAAVRAYREGQQYA